MEIYLPSKIKQISCGNFHVLALDGTLPQIKKSNNFLNFFEFIENFNLI